MLSEVLRAGRESTAELSPLSTPDSILMCYVTQVRHDRVGFMLMPINACDPYRQKKHDTMTQDSV